MHHTESPIEPTAETDSTNNEPAVVVEERRREPVWRVVGGSLASGLLGAIVLTLVVFVGASEHVTSGSALLAFAAGWAMLAMLSSRFTTQPQRWARVPAAFMAVAGLVLLVAKPDDQALNTAGWVWPPVVLALSVWMVIQCRRSLGGRVRWLIYPVMASLAIGSVGGLYETAAKAHDQQAYPAPGTLYDVGGHHLHMKCTGSGSPTVVLENGLGGASLLWTRITSEVSSTTRVCAYDRAGQGWSDDVGAPQDGLAIAADLHTLLARSGEPGPYLLVGHSAGGAYAMTFAAQYPDEVAGMVLLDSMTPDAYRALPDFATEQAMMRRGLGVLPSVARLGVARILPASAWSSLPEPAASQYQAFASSPRGMRSTRDEQSVYRDMLDQANALTSLHGKPLVVVTATESLEQIEGWADAQDRLAALSTNSQHRVADATHEGLLDDALAYRPSVTAISDVVHAIRADVPLVPA
ncbi:MAG TPA: alpha/beta hydrolase [Ilumatobacteraceae bacterium]|nr:alpha/beta hydrolase [Ilumatobacteraceae bacterium]